MKFELTDEVRNQIIFSMEDQGKSYVFDSVELKTVPFSEVEIDNDRYYKIPEWDSMDGFHLMERFVALLRNPLARESLRAVLFSGRGVFRNFKKVLREYPEVERLWYAFKENRMNRVIVEWYNVLCESWGLEALGSEPEENTDILRDDFIFREIDGEHDFENVFMSADSLLREVEKSYEGEVGLVIAEFLQRQRDYSEDCDEFNLIAETVDGDFAGCISASSVLESAPHTAVLSMIFVTPRYRGLGVGRELTLQCLEKLKLRGIHWVIVANIIVSGYAASMLRNCGFEQMGSGFIANL